MFFVPCIIKMINIDRIYSVMVYYTHKKNFRKARNQNETNDDCTFCR